MANVQDESRTRQQVGQRDRAWRRQRTQRHGHHFHARGDLRQPGEIGFGGGGIRAQQGTFTQCGYSTLDQPSGRPTGPARQFAARLQKRNQVMDGHHAPGAKRRRNKRGHGAIQPVVQISRMRRQSPAGMTQPPDVVPPHGRAAARIKEIAGGERPIRGQWRERTLHKVGIGRHAACLIGGRGSHPNHTLHGAPSVRGACCAANRAPDNNNPAIKANRNATSGSPKIWADTTAEATLATKMAKMPAVR